MFKCKFCLRELDKQEFESRSHFGMCKSCYTDTMKYKRIKIKGAKLDPKEAAFVKRFERQCKHNLSVGEYVPKYYTRGVDTKLNRCPYCGETDKPRYPHSPNMCYDCGSIANTYANTVRRLEGKIGWPKVTKTSKPAYAYNKALKTIDRIEQMYKHNEARGLKVPSLYLRRRIGGI